MRTISHLLHIFVKYIYRLFGIFLCLFNSLSVMKYKQEWVKQN